MNVAIIIAGGSGRRLGQEIPKQFITVYDKPIVVYTLECFQRHPEIDKIAVVCIDGWQEVMKAYAERYSIDKLEWIISGGATGQESIRNGVFQLEGLSEEDIVLIHDGVRPMITDRIISDAIQVAKEKGNAISSTVYNEQIFIADSTDTSLTHEFIPRNKIRRVSTPQAYQYKIVYDAYRIAFEKGIGISDSSYANTMMVDLGKTLYFSLGWDKNIKVTTKEDLRLFKAYLEVKNKQKMENRNFLRLIHGTKMQAWTETTERKIQYN